MRSGAGAQAPAALPSASASARSQLCPPAPPPHSSAALRWCTSDQLRCGGGCLPCRRNSWATAAAMTVRDGRGEEPARRVAPVLSTICIFLKKKFRANRLV